MDEAVVRPAEADLADVTSDVPGGLTSADAPDIERRAAPAPLPDDVPLRAGVEAILMVADEPVAAVAIAGALGLAVADVTAAIEDLVADYAAGGRGFELRATAGGWRIYTRAECAPYVERFVLDGQQTRLTQAALETLAVVAYRQPVSRGRISNIRGVNVDGVMRTLVTRGLVAEAGTDPSSGAVLYRTTDFFLERLGINDVTELPPLAPLLPELDSLELDDDRLSS
jgi:segregation and condensation protein B